MGCLCGCLSCDTVPPTPLDAEMKGPVDISVGLPLHGPMTRRIIGYPLNGARGPNFDFLTHDNGETYIATFRAMERREVVGFDSYPIPKEVFSHFRVIKKEKRGGSYAVVLETGDHDLDRYIHEFTEKEIELFGVKSGT